MAPAVLTVQLTIVNVPLAILATNVKSHRVRLPPVAMVAPVASMEPGTIANVPTVILVADVRAYMGQA